MDLRQPFLQLAILDNRGGHCGDPGGCSGILERVLPLVSLWRTDYNTVDTECWNRGSHHPTKHSFEDITNLQARTRS